VDSTGGTDPNTGVAWSVGTTNASWTQQTVAVTSGADYMTVFLKVAAADNNKRNGYFDDAAPAASTAAPQLTVHQSGNNLILTWPECPPTRLERADSLGLPWLTATNQITVNAGQNSITIPLTGNAGYFRLALE